MNAEEMQVFFNENFYYIVLAGVGIGLVLGLAPLLLGLRRNKRNLGLAGFLLSGIVGALSPLLSIIVAAIFTFLVVRKAPGQTTPKADDNDLNKVSG